VARCKFASASRLEPRQQGVLGGHLSGGFGHVQLGCQTVGHSFARDTLDVFGGAQIVQGDGVNGLGSAQLYVVARHLGHGRHQQVAPRIGLALYRGVRGLDRTAHAPPQVEFPGSVETGLPEVERSGSLGAGRHRHPGAGSIGAGGRAGRRSDHAGFAQHAVGAGLLARQGGVALQRGESPPAETNAPAAMAMTILVLRGFCV
jgi:hypothetical protein